METWCRTSLVPWSFRMDLERSPFLARLCRCRVVRYLWWGSGEMWLRKINLKEGTTRFRLVQTLSKSNRPTSNIIVLCCGRIGCPGWDVGCYLYKLKNRLIDMSNFQFCYNLNKHVSDWDSWLGVASNLMGRCSYWAPSPGNICGIVSFSAEQS
jgi:hypothetical protein